MRAILGLAAVIWTAATALATVAQYEVRGVAANDVLNIRSAPTHTAKVVGRIPPNGREIEIIARGKGQWVKVSYGRAQGFVNRRFLALSKPRVARAAPRPAVAAPVAPPAEAAVAVDPRALDEAAAPAPTASPAPTKLVAPAEIKTDPPGMPHGGLEDTPALMKPPAEFMPDIVNATPVRLSCKGAAPSWSMTTADNAGAFETSDGEKKRLEFSQLEPATGKNAVWMASGRAAESRMTLHIARTGACSNGTSDQSSPYEVTLRLEDGRLLNGCCQAGN